MEKIRGTVSFVIYPKGEGNYDDFRVVKFKILNKNGKVASETIARGPIPISGPDNEIELIGEWTVDPKYGNQFAVSAAERVIPKKGKELANFLSSEIEGIGPARAQKILDKFGDQAYLIISETPEKLAEIPGITPGLATKIGASWQTATNSEYTSSRMWLLGKGISSAYATRIVDHFAGNTIDILSNNPYRATEVDRVGFVVADALAKSLGWGLDSQERADAASVHVVSSACYEEGQTFLFMREYLHKMKKSLALEEGPAREALARSVEAGLVQVENIPSVYGTDEAVYLPHMLQAETRLAERITELQGYKHEAPPRLDSALETAQQYSNKKLSKDQVTGIRHAFTCRVSGVTGGPGTGKCLAPGTLLLMFDGSLQKVENVDVGDQLMGPDSKPRRVKSITQGEDDMFRVSPVKGGSFVCNSQHLLSLKRRRRKVKGELHELVPVQEFNHRSCRFKVKSKIWRCGVNWKEKPINLDPYFLGLWLGDGSSGYVTVWNTDPEIHSYLKGLAENLNMSLSKDYRPDKCSGFSIQPKTGRPNVILRQLRKLKVLHDKHIPLVYKANSRANRLKVLAGFIDADGHLDKCGVFTANLKSEILVKDVAFLARSLGLAAYVKQCQKTCTNNGKVGSYYSLCISGDLSVVPTRVRRKKASPRAQQKNVLRTGLQVENIGRGRYHGFTLDSEDGLFLLGDFTVTHNTELTNTLVRTAELVGLRCCLAAPTGRAAKRLSESTGRPASTIHRLLEFDPKEGSFNRHRTRPLEADIVVIDEASMLELVLGQKLLEAIPDNCSLVIIGDADQLPAVGAGTVLKDLIASGKVKFTKLEAIFRQAEGSDIIKNAHRIRRGEEPQFSPKGTPTDCYLMPVSQAQNPATGKMTDDISFVKGALERLCKEDIPRKTGVDPIKDIQILIPMKIGDAGAREINSSLQESLNPNGQKIPGSPFRIGDRVMQFKNNYRNEIFNGDIGFVESFDTEAGTTVIDFDGRKVPCNRKDLEEIQLAYAQTIHKSQGSEYPVVVVVMLIQHYRMLDRNLLYTATTRAKSMCLYLASKRALKIASATQNTSTRNSLLVYRIRKANGERQDTQ